MEGRRATRTLRERKVSQAMSHIDDASRQQAAIARLDALENDQNDGGAFAADENDEEVVLDSEGEEELGGKKKRGRKSGGGQRKKLRGGGTRGPKSFSRLLEDFVIERSGDTGPSYITAAAGPPRTGAPRKFCSICGMESQYTCSRCGQKYCKTKCFKTHCETRCLKFTL